MKIGCVEIARWKDNKKLASIIWKGVYLGILFGDETATQLLDLRHVKAAKGGYGQLSVFPTKELIEKSEKARRGGLKR